MKQLQRIEEVNRTVNFDLSDIITDEMDTSIQDLLTKQHCQFQALDRAMAKINLETSAEKWILEDQLSTLKSKWAPIDKLHLDIQAQLKGEDREYENMFFDIEDKYDFFFFFLSCRWQLSHLRGPVGRHVDTPLVGLEEVFPGAGVGTSRAHHQVLHGLWRRTTCADVGGRAAVTPPAHVFSASAHVCPESVE
ncbi:unnamed protein product [Plutella xylostella]|uniref:(diamondback moth) hypothetical protein n=1 Tax=Plutella xylostella TaxID=51655 RepID=A0A8S4G6A2_PLUXY|nr:unnamed protein product [Plutella xylostella]